MIRVYIKRNKENYGRVFKSSRSVKNDRIAALPWYFVYEGLIKQQDYAHSLITIEEYFELEISETRIDGRGKVARSLKNFSWNTVLRGK